VRRGHQGRTDSNHSAIVAQLRAVGATVVSLAAVGGACPDLLVGFRARTYLLEVKPPLGPRGGRSSSKRSEGQRRFALAWRGGPVVTVRSPVEALDAIGLHLAAPTK
tara:strand:+ start:246 stop:566 length:321 start_codon:yes stop_codon:yes gene_type:complete